MVKAEFTLFGVMKREGDWYIAHCPPLDLTTQGKTLAAAKKNLIGLPNCLLLAASNGERWIKP